MFSRKILLIYTLISWVKTCSAHCTFARTKYFCFANLISEKQYLIAVLLGIFLIGSEAEHFLMFIGHLYFLLWELPIVSYVYFSLDDFIFWSSFGVVSLSLKSTFGILLANMSPCSIIFSFIFYSYLLMIEF